MTTLHEVHMAAGGEATTINASDYSDLVRTPHCDAFAFSETEQVALRLYDKLRELELEKSLLEAHAKEVSDVLTLSDDVLQEHLIVAEREAMEAKAKFEIRNRASHHVIIMDPVLKSVHGGQQHTLEKRVLPLITENDAVSMVHGMLATRQADMQRALRAAEQSNITINMENRNKSRTVLKLAEKVKAQSLEDVTEPRLREQIEKAERSVRDSRKRSKIIKGMLSAMIVGSGINWAADEELRELVMDDEDAG